MNDLIYSVSRKKCAAVFAYYLSLQDHPYFANSGKVGVKKSWDVMLL